MLNSSFLTHEFNEADRLWLQTAAAERPFDPRGAKARLYGKLPPDFDPYSVDRRFYRDDRLTLLGIRVFRPADPIFAAIEKLILSLREKILAEPTIDSLSVQEMAALTGEPDSLIRHAVSFLSTLGPFFSGQQGPLVS